MEQLPPRPDEEGEQTESETEQASVEITPVRARQIIDEGIQFATQADQDVEDWVAVHIARQLIGSDTSALDRFIRTGEIAAVLRSEVHYEVHSSPRQRWIEALSGYVADRDDPGPVEAWAERTAIRDWFDVTWRAAAPWGVRDHELSEFHRLVGEARLEGRPIDDELALRILVQLAPNPHSAVARFVADGRVTDDLGRELETSLQEGDPRVQRLVHELVVWLVDKHGANSLSPSVKAPPDRSPKSDGEATRHDRLAELDARLAPLPDLGDIPRSVAQRGGTGYDWMEQLPQGWYPESSWGRNGWDLGTWPLIVVSLFIDKEGGRYAVATYTEGDVDVKRYASRGALYVAVNRIAEFHWRLGQSRGPKDLPEGEGLRAKHCGPYSEERHDREVTEERARLPRAGDADDLG